VRGELFLGLLVLFGGCHDPSSDTHPSPQASGTPPVPPAPVGTTELNQATAADTYGRFRDAEPQVKDGAVACSIVLQRSVHAGPDYILQNTGNTDLRSCRAVFYAYDANGDQLARIEADPMANMKKGDVLHSGQSLRGLLGGEEARRLEKSPGVTWEVVVTRVTFADGTTWTDPSRAPPQRKSQAIKK